MIEVRKAIQQADLENIHKIRRIVFIEEQQCPPDLEWENEEEAIHFLATINGIAGGTARWLQTQQGFKLQRFAVLKEFRGMGVGEALIKSILNDLPAEAKSVYLHGQIHACGFYKKFGFVIEGEEFMEAGIRHYKMVLKR